MHDLYHQPLLEAPSTNSLALHGAAAQYIVEQASSIPGTENHGASEGSRSRAQGVQDRGSARRCGPAD